jgi:4-phosphopantoate--beta-alanine ligase
MTRERLAEGVSEGLVDPTGLISHGRGEAFDYLMGERSIPPALEAERAAAAFLLKARNPVVCMNGNSVVLDPEGLIALAEAVPARMEVNIFHRTEERMERLIRFMESKGARNVLGRDPDAWIEGLSHARALCTREGVFSSDAILVPIEDGDRAEALVAMGKTVISIDLNPLSRTSRTATVPISDEISRALANIKGFVEDLRGRDGEIERITSSYSGRRTREQTVAFICDNLKVE